MCNACEYQDRVNPSPSGKRRLPEWQANLVRGKLIAQDKARGRAYDSHTVVYACEVP